MKVKMKIGYIIHVSAFRLELFSCCISGHIDRGEVCNRSLSNFLLHCILKKNLNWGQSTHVNHFGMRAHENEAICSTVLHRYRMSGSIRRQNGSFIALQSIHTNSKAHTRCFCKMNSNYGKTMECKLFHLIYIPLKRETVDCILCITDLSFILSKSLQVG